MKRTLLGKRLRFTSQGGYRKTGSLRNQLLVRSLLLMSILFLLVGIFQYLFMQNFLYRNKAEALQAQIAALPPVWLLDPESADIPDRWNGDQNVVGPIVLPPGLSIQYIDDAGIPRSLRGEAASDDVPVSLSRHEYESIRNRLASREKPPFQIVQDPSGQKKMVVFRLAGKPGNHGKLIQATTELASLQNQLFTQLAIYASLSILALGAGLALHLPLLRRTLGPLSNVVQAAESTDAGNLSKRVPDGQGQEEIDRLSRAFNGMLERLDAAFLTERAMTEQMRRFIADASHELRTPLTSIRGFIEVLQRGAALHPDQLAKSLDSMDMESARLNKLVEDLLLLAKMDQGPSLQAVPVRLDELLLGMEEQLSILAEGRGLTLTLPEAITVSGDSDKLKQVVLNLVHNAVQHTNPSTGTLSINLCRQKNSAVLSVQDNGSGIDETHLPHLFDRFYRGEASRSRRKGGAGLGLAITKSIVEAHRGSIAVNSEPGQGSLFRITLPLISAWDQ